MNILVCGNYVNDHIWSSYFLNQYSSLTRVRNYRHEEMRSDYPQDACLSMEAS